MDLTIYLLIAFLVILLLVVYCYCWCKRFHREIAEERGIQTRYRSNSDHGFSYWTNGWPVSYPDSHKNDHSVNSYQNSGKSNHNNECHINFGNPYLCESELPR